MNAERERVDYKKIIKHRISNHHNFRPEAHLKVDECEAALQLIFE